MINVIYTKRKDLLGKTLNPGCMVIHLFYCLKDQKIHIKTSKFIYYFSIPYINLTLPKTSECLVKVMMSFTDPEISIVLPQHPEVFSYLGHI